jgi:hypothetical protein
MCEIIFAVRIGLLAGAARLAALPPQRAIRVLWNRLGLRTAISRTSCSREFGLRVANGGALAVLDMVRADKEPARPYRAIN